MPVKVTATGKLVGPIRQIDGICWFEIEAEASKSAPKGLPVPSDATVTLICNEKQLRPCRERIEQGDRAIAQGELALDVPASKVGGDVAVVVYQLTTVGLEQEKKPQAEGADRPSGESGDTERLPDLRLGEATPFPLSAIIIPQTFLQTGLNPAKLEAARQELAARKDPGPLEVAMLHGHPVLQDGYRRYVVLMEAQRPMHPVTLTENVRFPMTEKEVVAAVAKRQGASAPDVRPDPTTLSKKSPVPQAPAAPKAPVASFTCGKCPQKVHHKLAVISDGVWCCPDCAAGVTNPVTNLAVRVWDRGFPATDPAVREFVKLTGCSYSDPAHGPLHVRLSVILGMLFRHNQEGDRRAYVNQGLLFHVKRGEIYSVTAAPAFANKYRTLKEMVEICMDIDARDQERKTD